MSSKSNADQVSSSETAVNPVIDEATLVLMSSLHCGQAEALGLLQSWSHWGHRDLVKVAAAVVEADFPDRRWGWKPDRQTDPWQFELAMGAAA